MTSVIASRETVIGESLPYWTNGVATLYLADSRSIPLPDQSAHVCVTSPPYYGLRVYQGNDERGLGLESSVDQYLDSLMEVMGEVWRVLREDGILWVNLSDSYAGSGRHGSEHANPGLSKSGQRGADIATPKSGMVGGQLLMVPERFCLRMVDAGWIHRDKPIWIKASCMPESVSGTSWQQHRVKVEKDSNRSRDGLGPHPGGEISLANGAKYRDCPGCDQCRDTDGLVLHQGSGRCTRSYEPIFMFTKKMGYFSDFEAVRVEHKEPWRSTGKLENRGTKDIDGHANNGFGLSGVTPRQYNPAGANRRNVWTDIKPDSNSDKTCPECGRTFTRRVYQRFPKVKINDALFYICPRCEEPLIAHYATFPVDLPRLCIQASTSEAGACPGCGAQWARVLERTPGSIRGGGYQDQYHESSDRVRLDGDTRTLSWRQSCQCPPHQPVPPVVLDPFAGTCTTAVAAQRLGRKSVMVDLSPEYLAQGKARLLKEPLPMMGM